MVSGIKVAERHAEITLAEDGHIIRDLESSVGTLVNGVEIVCEAEFTRERPGRVFRSGRDTV